MENLQVMRQSHIERIRKITSKWLVGQDIDGVNAMHEIAAVLVEPEPLALTAPSMSADDLDSFRRYWKEQISGAQAGERAADQEVERLQGEVRRLNERWDREVLGLNNEGDPIGGEPTGGMKNEIERLRIQVADLTQQLAGEREAAREVAIERFRQEAEARLSQAATDVLAERRRQVEVEGWTPEHDDEHDAGEPADYGAVGDGVTDDTAAIQAAPAPARSPTCGRSKPAGGSRPTPRRALVKAGAMILAEIERIDRAEESMSKVSGLGVIECAQPLSEETVATLRSCNFLGTQSIELYTAAAEARMDVVGQNGNDGAVYAELAELAIQQGGKPVDELPDGLSWEQAPEATTVLLENRSCPFADSRYVWASKFAVGAKARYAFGGQITFHLSDGEMLGNYRLVATRPAPAEGRDATQG